MASAGWRVRGQRWLWGVVARCDGVLYLFVLLLCGCIETFFCTRVRVQGVSRECDQSSQAGDWVEVR